MAEIGLIASVIQVAGAGLKLSQTLYEYAETVASADRRIKDIAKEVELTSWVIDELGDIFKKESTAALLSKKAAKTADDTVRECYNVFTELEAAIKKTKKNTLGRLMLPFRESKMDLLRSHIDKLKSTLQLLMQVLTHAHQIASHKLDREAEEAQREQIKVLIQGKKESTKRYEESLKSYSLSEQSTVLGDRDLSDMGGMTVSAYSISSTITVKGLETCVQHIQGLLQDIENLQQALSSENAGNDPSEHQQSLVGSYFQAREHLDAVILGSSKVIANVATDDKESTVRAEPRKASAEVYKTTRREEHVKSVEDMQKTRAEVDVERLKRAVARAGGQGRREKSGWRSDVPREGKA
ncbi:hypothetical protein BCR34DRAFT_626037 [Clohesyomyces aquaticus]|uniref:Fungal N-terminal domain-containing protein n=1 Tax=Clohesyomyces aquaticus TaxID=1231657 RepID=A0A1Y1ZFB4_9PLEO|nr:hypothetical protein BCR34DRAFT_626037 [Clohesyomyces aquaticus]